MDHARCAQCRNPIRGRQSRVHHALADMTYHADCWQLLHAAVQRSYREGCRGDDSLVAVMEPYHRQAIASWVPAAAVEEAALLLAEGIEDHLEEAAVDTPPAPAPAPVEPAIPAQAAPVKVRAVGAPKPARPMPPGASWSTAQGQPVGPADAEPAAEPEAEPRPHPLVVDLAVAREQRRGSATR